GISRGCLSRCDLRDDRSHHHSQAALPPGASGGSCEPGPLGKPFDARGTRGDSFTSMRITILSPSRKRAIKMSQHIQELRFNFSGLRWIILVFALAFCSGVQAQSWRWTFEDVDVHGAQTSIIADKAGNLLHPAKVEVHSLDRTQVVSSPGSGSRLRLNCLPLFDQIHACGCP